MTSPPEIEVAEHALAVLAAFLADYTDPDDDGHRARVFVVGGSVSEGFFDVKVAREGCGVSPRFRVSVCVGPAPEPVVGLTLVSRDEASDRGGVSSRDEPGVVRPVSGTGFRT